MKARNTSGWLLRTFLVKCGGILKNRYFEIYIFYRKSGVFLNTFSDDLGKVRVITLNKSSVSTFGMLKVVSDNIVLVEQMPPR